MAPNRSIAGISAQIGTTRRAAVKDRMVHFDSSGIRPVFDFATDIKE
ncbi:MAG TPA: hypothetical protein VMV69_12930 [Pirellulales bacterium]|nr:hypothetical protein [Pirellulales bacterium]